MTSREVALRQVVEARVVVEMKEARAVETRVVYNSQERVVEEKVVYMEGRIVIRRNCHPQ